MKFLSHKATVTDSRYDILKFVMALMIVILHTSFYPSVFLPWVRVAVPIFFILSSYFFFSKINKLHTQAERRGALRRFVKRSCILYLFWFAVLIVPTVRDRHWFDDGMFTGLCNMVYDIGFANTFRASWFISANVIAICIVYSLRRHRILTGIIGAISFLLCCLTSNYYYAAPGLSKAVCSILYHTQYYFSFPAAMLWVWLGMMAAGSSWRGKTPMWIAAVIVGAVMLWLEHNLVTTHHWVRDNDVYLSLAVLCTALFGLVRSLRVVSNPSTIILRYAGIIFYCTHATVAQMMRLHLKGMGITGDRAGVINFAVTLLVCIIVTAVILALSGRKGFKWLKYSY